MFGSTRKKKTSLVTNAKCFEALEVKCDDQHKHAQWGVKWTEGHWKFATAEEAEYPKELCNAMAKAIATHYHDDPGLPPVIFKAHTGNLH